MGFMYCRDYVVFINYVHCHLLSHRDTRRNATHNLSLSPVYTYLYINRLYIHSSDHPPPPSSIFFPKGQRVAALKRGATGTPLRTMYIIG